MTLMKKILSLKIQIIQHLKGAGSGADEDTVPNEDDEVPLMVGILH